MKTSSLADGARCWPDLETILSQIDITSVTRRVLVLRGAQGALQVIYVSDQNEDQVGAVVVAEGLQLVLSIERDDLLRQVA